ncbi:MAG: GntR family transcriptional regulator [Gammaproteobacteria bacterium]|nr:FadR family transcriptional regulator [Pseudomonadales bacterium]MCP5348887.1 FadR family transcriptional regulator [Pseudomonadales bacterium]
MTSPTSVSYEIAGRLRTEILSGRFRVGDRMASERDLAARFGVSRGAVREALSLLEQQGIIEIQPGGARVRPLEEASLAVLGPLLALEEVPDPDLVDQFLEIFSMLTALTVRGAVEQASVEQLIQLKRMLVDIAQCADDFEAMQPHWQALLDYMAGIDNNLVARLIGNDVKAQVLGPMLQLNIRPRLPAGAGTELVKTLTRAFNRQDGALAASAFETHFDQLRRAMREALQGMREALRRQVV